MENTHNTTILSSRLTPSPWLGDAGYVYMEGVKVHEFYHDLNGTRVTGATPFELWLNEAVTVHVQRQREHALFTFDFMRLGQVAQALTPGAGPLAQDRSPVAMAVEPAGFNTTHELISAMTYSKAPEFVRGVELLLGAPAFNRALHAYHTQFAFGNATSADWVACMAREAPPGLDLDRYARGWLRRAGHPTVTLAAQHYDATSGTFTATLRQTGFERHADSAEPGPWVVPLDYALVKDGRVLAEGLFVLDSEHATLAVHGVAAEPDFISLARGFSFFGEVVNAAASPAQLNCQALTDPDAVNRYLAWQRVLDDEKARLVEALRTGAAALVSVSPAVVAVYAAILADPALGPGLRGRLLDVTTALASRPDLGHYYGHLAAARTAILQAVHAAHGALLLRTYSELAAASQGGHNFVG
jgi:aminopeptidase N